MNDLRSVVLNIFRFSFYVRILGLILINLYLFYYLAVLAVQGDVKVFFMFLIPIVFIIIFILGLSYVNFLNAKGINNYSKGIYSRIFLYLVFEGLALFITGFNNRYILLYIGLIDLFLAFIFSRKPIKNLYM